jgi:RimJ/RimL family protein N-acetyltransferase
VTVASFNARARRVVESLGFQFVARFKSTMNGEEYDVLRQTRSATRSRDDIA